MASESMDRAPISLDDVRQILDNAAVGLTHCSRDLRYLACNPAYEKIVGLPAEQIIGRPIVEVMGTKAFEAIRPYIGRILRGERVEFEQEVPLSAGGPRFFHAVGEPLIDSEGQVTGWIASVSEITELKRATKALLESEERLRLAVSGTIGIWDWCLSTGHLALSPELCEILGVEAGVERTYEDFRSRVHPDDLAAVESERVTAVRNHEQFDLEFRIVRPSGEIRWLSARGRGHYDENGRVVRVAGINIDITERVKAKEALREREQRLKLALDASAGGSWTWDIGTNRVDWDDRFRKLYGFAPEEPPTFDAWFSRVHEEDRSSMLGLVDEVLKKGTRDDWDNTFRIIRPDGTTSWIESLGQVDRDAEGQVMRLTGLELDVTNRRLAEEALRESEQRLRLALDASRAGSWMLDARTGRAEWDDRYREIYGLTNAEPASFESWLSRVHEEDRQLVLAVVDRLMQTKTQDTFDCTFRIVQPNGGVSWIQSLGQAHRDAEGEVIRFTGLELDVWERRRAEEVLQARREEERDRSLHKQAEEALRGSHVELEQSHAELARRTLQLSRLASQLTLAEQTVRKQLASTLHDGLQQLLFSTGITLDQALKPSSKDDQVKLLQRARALVTEAVEAARTLSLNLFPPVLHVGGLPAALSWLARRTQEQYGIVVNVTADPQANPEASDVRILLFEGVRELLFNAVKHAHIDRVDVNLALGSGDTIYIQVSDDGAGYDPSATHDRNQPQAGLGLFSIQERLALRGGHLDIVSAPGKGSRFTLTLPRTGQPLLATDGIATAPSDTDRQDRLIHDAAHGTSKALRILIADDHAVVRAGLRELFSERPELRVVGEAANGVEAISHAKAMRPDVILMDVGMPRKNGIEATREIHDRLPHIHIVGLSTYGDETTELAMRDAGAQAYFSKTESTDRLFDYVLSLHNTGNGGFGNLI